MLSARISRRQRVVFRLRGRGTVSLVGLLLRSIGAGSRAGTSRRWPASRGPATRRRVVRGCGSGRRATLAVPRSPPALSRSRTATTTTRRRATGPRLSFIVNAIPCLSFVDAEGRYVWVNEFYRSLRPRPRHHPRAAPSWALGPRRSAGTWSAPFETQLIDRAGRVSQISAAYVPQRGRSGRVRGFVSLVTDVSEWKRAEEALRHTERMLEESQRPRAWAAGRGCWRRAIRTAAVRSGGQRRTTASSATTRRRSSSTGRRSWPPFTPTIARACRAWQRRASTRATGSRTSTASCTRTAPSG